MKKRLLASAGAAVIGITSIASMGIASAATNPTNGQTSLIDRIATKFNLNKDEVKVLFDTERSEHHTEMQTKQKERLAQAVTNGKLTQDQADKIAAKREEMHTYMESLKDKTDAERKAAMEAKREEFKKWATENNIPEEFVRGPGGHGQRGHGRGEGEKPADSTDN